MKLLYCIVYNHVNLKTKEVTAGTRYLHAEGQAQAKRKFCRMFPNRQTHQIIDAAPSVGVFVDSNGEQSVD